MKVVIALSHSGFFRHFDTVVTALLDQGHEVKALVRGKPKGDIDSEYQAEMLETVGAHERGSYELVLHKRLGIGPGLIRRLQGIMDYGIYHRYQHNSPQMAVRMDRRCPRPIQAFWRTRVGRRLISSDAFLAAYRRFQAHLPAGRKPKRHLREIDPDVVVCCPYIYRNSNDQEYARAAQKLGIPTVAVVASWDNLSTKGTFHLLTDSVVVWNDGLAKEARVIHGLGPDRLLTTGAAKFDHYFELDPSETREQFCQRIGLDAERPYMLYIGSSQQVAGDETGFVTEMTQALNGDPRTADLQVVVRPHPLNGEVWQDFHHEGIVVFPRGGQRPDIPGPRDEYFNTLVHAAAVVGVNTSAFLEAAIADRPCLSIVSERHREGQVERGHFQHLLKGRFIETVPDYAGAVVALGDILEGHDARQGLRRRFVESFVRPGGIDRRAGEVVAEAIVATGAGGVRPPEPILPARRAALPRPAKVGRERRRPTEEEERAALLRLHDEHPIPVRQPLVLLAQLGDGGGELLNRLLDGHPGLHGRPQRLALGGRAAWPELDLDASPDEWWEALREPPRPAASGNGSGNGQALPFLMVPTLQRRVFDHCAADWGPSSQRDVLDCYMTAYFNAWLDYQGLYGEGRRWVSVFGDRLGLADADRQGFFADYPDGRLVLVLGVPGNDVSGWTDAAEALLPARREHGDRLLVVGLRELVAGDPEAAMREVAGFLGLEWDPVLTRPTLNGLAMGAEAAVGPGAGGDGEIDGRAGELYRQLVSAGS